jgi:hypothetical protein
LQVFLFRTLGQCRTGGLHFQRNGFGISGGNEITNLQLWQVFHAFVGINFNQIAFWPFQHYQASAQVNRYYGCSHLGTSGDLDRIGLLLGGSRFFFGAGQRRHGQQSGCSQSNCNCQFHCFLL